MLKQGYVSCPKIGWMVSRKHECDKCEHRFSYEDSTDAVACTFGTLNTIKYIKIKEIEVNNG